MVVQHQVNFGGAYADQCQDAGSAEG